ncbi:MAG: polyphosphate kinase 1 [Phycisphaerales bacterium]
MALPRPDIRPDATSFNRDFSWLEFNARVLHLAQDDSIPLLERLRFLAIFTSNLDEFVMKRVGWLKLAAEVRRETDDGLPADKVLAHVRATFEHLEGQQEAIYAQLRPHLATEGIELLNYTELSDDERRWAEAWFRTNVFPVLTPLAVDPGHRFPFISNLSQNLGVMLQEPGSQEQLFARVKVPPAMPQWVRIDPPDGTAGVPAPSLTGTKRDLGRGRFVQLWELIRHNLDDLFPGMKITEVVPFRVTRAAEGAATMEAEDADNLLDFVEAQLKRRRFANVVRLELAREASPQIAREIVEMFKIKPEDTDISQGLLDFRSLLEIADLPRADLKYAPWLPVVPPRVAAGESIFEVIRRGDLLVHHPYESFVATTERFIAEAAADPSVLAIKQTIYRTSRDSPFLQHLIKAAENGKQVACLVELQARFDESRNVRLAQALEKAGVHVAYGVVGLKTHCKAALVVRRESDGPRCYAHIGTGNYNPATAKLYTDLGLLTCDPRLTEDVVDLFNLLTGRSRKSDYHRLLVAPATMKRTFLQSIRREASIAEAHARGESPVGGRIVAKMNALEDAAVIRELYRASQAGVRIALFVRGFCTLRPGIEGLSENISVTSVVGRFLEHSRIFHFGAGRADPLEGDWYIGSGDWMSRNLDARVEAAAPVLDSVCRAKLQRLIDIMAADSRCAWDLRPDGGYTHRDPRTLGPEVGVDAPERLGTFETLIRETARIA